MAWNWAIKQFMFPLWTLLPSFLFGLQNADLSKTIISSKNDDYETVGWMIGRLACIFVFRENNFRSFDLSFLAVLWFNFDVSYKNCVNCNFGACNFNLCHRRLRCNLQKVPKAKVLKIYDLFCLEIFVLKESLYGTIVSI